MAKGMQGSGRASTIEDVARLAGVSIKTVSRVVNGEPKVRPSTQLRVQAAVRELDYRPNLSARNLASQNARLIVLIYDDPSVYTAPSSGYIIKLQEGALAACRQLGYELLIHPCNPRSRQAGLELSTLNRRVRPTGVVLAPPLSNTAAIVDAIAESGVPLVLLSPGTREHRGFAVNTTNRDSCRDMVAHLAGLGHRRIAFIRGNPRHRAVGERYSGFKEGLREAQLPLYPELVVQGDNSIGSGEDCAQALLTLAQPPTAIFAANDDMAAGVIRTAVKLGVTIPDQLSVAGCDDIALARQVYPSLTTIHQPFAAMAQRAVCELIERRGEGGAITGSALIPSQLRVRESTGPAAGSRSVTEAAAASE